MKKSQKWSLYGMSALYFFAGVNHFYNPDFYSALLESRFSNAEWWVIVSGIAEIGLAVLLLIPATRNVASWLICAMLVVFLFTVHVPMVVETGATSDAMYWILVLRIPIQFILIYWAYSLGKIARQ
jgi:uncharacterized membrane protein